jgi:hypothetical protein
VKKFEYKRVPYMDGRVFINDLNRMGEEGWELVSIFIDSETTAPPGDHYCVAYLKRECKK